MMTVAAAPCTARSNGLFVEISLVIASRYPRPTGRNSAAVNAADGVELIRKAGACFVAVWTGSGFAVGTEVARGDVGPGQPAPESERRRNVGSGALVGVACAGFVDEAVFHQLLHWHHFYDKSTPAWGLVSDGLFHVGTFFAIVAGLFLFAELRRRRVFQRTRWWGGFLVGAGGFQLYDGTIQHKWLRLHQIRYHVTLWPYDTVWLAVAAVVLVAGVVLLVRARRFDARRA